MAGSELGSRGAAPFYRSPWLGLGPGVRRDERFVGGGELSWLGRSDPLIPANAGIQMAGSEPSGLQGRGV